MQHISTSNKNIFGSEIDSIIIKMKRINQEVVAYVKKLENHPIAKLCEEQKIPTDVLNDFAKIQFVDSILWVPMLALLKGKIKSPRLLQAVRANMLCEAGAEGVPHVTLCQQFVESLGIMPRYGDYNEFSKYSAHPIEVMMSLQDCEESFVAGWLLAAEALVPIMFRIFKAAYKNLEGVDMTYFNEHIVVDTDEHAQWMRESIQELLLQSDCFDLIMAGIDIGGRITLCIPDLLFSKTVRLHKLSGPS